MNLAAHNPNRTNRDRLNPNGVRRYNLGNHNRNREFFGILLYGILNNLPKPRAQPIAGCGVLVHHRYISLDCMAETAWQSALRQILAGFLRASLDTAALPEAVSTLA
jgi:hypothetical protein